MNELILAPRQSGKTTFLIEYWNELIKGDKTIIVIVRNLAMKKHFVKEASNNYNFKYLTLTTDSIISSCDELQLRLLGHKEVHILVDEYMFLQEPMKQYLAELSLNDNRVDITAVSTLNKLYDEKLIKAIRALKILIKSGNSDLARNLENSIRERWNTPGHDNYLDVFGNIISCPNCILETNMIVIDDFGMDRETYDREILGKVWK